MSRFLGRILVVSVCLVSVALARVPRTARAGDFDFERYHDFEDFERYLQTAASRFPHIAQLKHIGTSREGRKLLGLKIGSRKGPENKPGVWIDGGNHAREWPAFHLCIYFIDKLLDGYGSVEQITNYVDRLNIYIFPVLNPDGFIFSRTSTKDSVRQWRKNRAPANCTGRRWSKSKECFGVLSMKIVAAPTKINNPPLYSYTNFKKIATCCEGVDLNRNWDVGFKQTNYPFNNPCSDEYQGPEPFSEPESRAVRDFVMSNEINSHVHAMVSLHTHGQLFIIPYNFQRFTYPEDYKDLENVARRAANAIYNVHGETEYHVGTAADMFGPATGGAIDWIKMNSFIKYVYVIELPPPLTTFFAFQMRPHWLVPTAKETFAGMEVIFRQVIHEFSN